MDDQAKESLVSGGSTATHTTGAPSNINKIDWIIEDPKIKNVCMFKFNRKGNLAALVKAGGKNIHIVDVDNAKKVVAHLYRGMKQASIKSVDFSSDDRFFALISNSLKIPIFNIGQALRYFEDTGKVVKIKRFFSFTT